MKKYFFTFTFLIFSVLHLFGETSDLYYYGGDYTENVILNGGVTDIAAGFNHILVLKDDGSVWAAGENLYGQIGNGRNSCSESLQKIIPGHCVKVFAGGAFSLVLKDDGSLWGFGANEFGQLGIGNNEDVLSPICIKPSGVKDVSAGAFHLMVLKDDGSLLVAGRNSFGALGDNSDKDSNSFISIFSTGIVDIAAGDGFSVVLKSDGSMWGTGINFSGQLGINPSSNDNKHFLAYVKILDSGIKQIAAAGRHLVFIKDNSSVWGCGRNFDCELGQPQSLSIFSPVEFFNSNIKDIFLGDYQTFVLNNSGTLFGCGRNFENQIIPFSDQNVTSFTELNSNIKKVAAAQSSTFFLNENGSLFAIGDEQLHIIGALPIVNNNVNEPNWKNQIFSSDVKIPIAGKHHSLVIKTDNSLWGYGDNSFGQLGVGNTNNQDSPVSITDNVAAAAAGDYHSLIVKNDSSLLACGKNNMGQLGNSSTTDSNTPVVIFNSGVAKVAAGIEHSLILKTDGVLLACGSNAYGQLGTGAVSTNPVSTPVQVMDSVSDIAAGDSFSVVLKNNGSVWCFGRNNYGQLGNGTTNNLSAPQQIISSDIVAVFAGPENTFCLKNDGSVLAFGNNAYFQLGLQNYDTSGVQPPTLIKKPATVIIDNVSKIFPAKRHTLFLKNDNSLWGCGINSHGQMCLAPSDNSYFIPAKILDNVSTASARGSFSLVASKLFKLSFTSDSNGSLTGAADQLVKAGMDSEPVSAVPNSNYLFSNWQGDYESNNNPIVVEDVQSDMNINAVFISEANSALLNISIVGKGSCVPGNFSSVFTLNTPIQISATPEPGYSFVNWTVSSAGTLADPNAASTTVTITGNTNLTANFQADGQNIPPIALDDTYSVNISEVLTVSAPGVLNNDSDADNNSLTAVLNTIPKNGILLFHSDGSFSYTPNADFSGIDSFTYYVSDGTDNSNSASVYLQVLSNSAPLAAQDSFIVEKNSTFNLPAPGVLVNDTSINGKPLTAILVQSTEHGTITLNADGSFSYTPENDYEGSDLFIYKISSDNVESQNALVELNVIDFNPVNNLIQDGLVLWFDGDDVDGDGTAEGVNEDGVAADGAVSVWVDKAGGDNNGTPKNSSYKPKLIENTMNGKSALHFSNQTDKPDTLSFAEVNDIRTVFWVVLDEDGKGIFLGHSSKMDFKDSVDSIWFMYYTADAVKNGNTYLDGKIINGVRSDIPWNKFCFLDLVTTGNVSANQIGQDRAYDGVWKGFYAELLIYNKPLNDSDRINVEKYLRRKWLNLSPVDDSFSISQGSSLEVRGLLIDNDINENNVDILVVKRSDPQHGKIIFSSNGSFSYIPDPSFSGTDSFTYSLSDGIIVTDSATVTINIQPAASHLLTVNNGIGSGSYTEGETVRIFADDHSGIGTFSQWTGDVDTILDINQTITSVIIPNHDVTVNAEFYVPESSNSFSISGSITGDVTAEVPIRISGAVNLTIISNPNGTYSFDNLPNGNYIITPLLSSYAFSPSDKTVTVNCENVNGIDFTSTSSVGKYTLTVNNGTGSGTYSENDNINISPIVPAGQVFDGWTGDTQYIADSSAASTTVTMPAQNVSVTATFKQAPPNTHNISGTVTGDIQQGVIVTADATHSATTDASGNYTISGPADGT